MKILYIDACVRERSRTGRLAERLLNRLAGDVVIHRLSQETFPVADEAFLNLRDDLIEKGEFDHPMFRLAREFALADTIVIAAPYWDLSFPAALKQYIEQINVIGVTFRYSDEGVPVGLCRAKTLFYVTTAGGDYVPTDFGFGYIRELSQSFYGISDVRLIQAVALDIVGADEEAILKDCEDRIDHMEIL